MPRSISGSPWLSFLRYTVRDNLERIAAIEKNTNFGGKEKEEEEKEKKEGIGKESEDHFCFDNVVGIAFGLSKCGNKVTPCNVTVFIAAGRYP